METGMYPYKIEIDANRADNGEHWRVYRIYMVLGYAQALADLESIYDHKGTLSVSWITEPTEDEKEYLNKAWGSIVTDYEGNPIEHEI